MTFTLHATWRSLSAVQAREASAANLSGGSPFIEHTLVIGPPGDIFDSDFRLHLEECHRLRDGQAAMMGTNKAEDVMVYLGRRCDDDKGKLWYQAGRKDQHQSRSVGRSIALHINERTCRPSLRRESCAVVLFQRANLDRFLIIYGPNPAAAR